jgi:hypothetical protein
MRPLENIPCRDGLIADWLEVVVMDFWGVVLLLNLLLFEFCANEY